MVAAGACGVGRLSLPEDAGEADSILSTPWQPPAGGPADLGAAAAAADLLAGFF